MSRCMFATIYVKSEDPRDTAEWFVYILGAQRLGETILGNAPAIELELGGVPLTVCGSWDDELALPACIQPRYGVDSLALYVNDLAAEIEALTAKGCVFWGEIEEFAGTRAIFIEGPERMRIQLIEKTEG